MALFFLQSPLLESFREAETQSTEYWPQQTGVGGEQTVSGEEKL